MSDTDNNPSVTLLHVLEQGVERLLVYDIGRRIGALPRETFVAFEQARAPYPLPMQRKAWFALVQTEARDAAEPLI